MGRTIDERVSDSEIVAAISGRQRICRLSNIMIVISYFGIPACPICSLIFWSRSIIVGVTFATLLVVCILTCVFLGKRTRKLESTIKEMAGQYIVKDVLSTRIEVNEYSPERFINRDFAEKCSILPSFNKISGSDYVSGSYRGKRFVFCDLTLEIEEKYKDRNGHNRTRTTPRFQGQLMKLDLGQQIPGSIQITERKNPRKSKGFLAGLFGGDSYRGTIKTSNEAFNNQFDVRATTEELAYQFLTPQFMESVMRTDQLASGYTNIEFDGTSVVVTFNNGKDAFELKKTLSSRKRLNQYRQDFSVELDIILGIFDQI